MRKKFGRRNNKSKNNKKWNLWARKSSQTKAFKNDLVILMCDEYEK